MTDVRASTHYVQDTPTLDTSVYADGDFLGSVQGVQAGNGTDNCTLKALTVLDKADQGTEIDFYFFSSQPTVASADNAAISISDAEMEKCTGKVTVAGADYDDFTGSKCGFQSDLKVPVITDADGKFWVVMVSRGTPTYAASSLVIGYHLEYNS